MAAEFEMPVTVEQQITPESIIHRRSCTQIHMHAEYADIPECIPTSVCARTRSRTHAYAQPCKVRIMFIDGVCLKVSNCERLSIRSPWSSLAAERRNTTVLHGRNHPCTSSHISRHTHTHTRAETHTSGTVSYSLTHKYAHTSISMLLIHDPVAAELSYHLSSPPSHSMRRALTRPDSLCILPI